MGELRDALTSLLDYVSSVLTLSVVHPYQSSSHVNDFSREPFYRPSIEMPSNLFPTADSSRRYLDATIGWPYFAGSELVQLLKEYD